ncbi:MAG TPA: hypothetical protein DDY98_04625 [Ruminococcaceae bacterium]|nr:hypothetical protein [Oscillospiraceae bacterium]
MILYVVRHGESLGNVCDDFTLDPELTELGQHQTDLLGKRFSSLPLTAVYASPLLRAVATANAVVRQQPSNGAKNIRILPDLMEKDTEPDYAGLDFEELKKRFPAVEPFIPCCLGTEDEKIIFVRAKRVIERITSAYTLGESVMLCAHGTFNQYLLAAALGMEQKANYIFCQLNTAVTKITYHENNSPLRLTYMDDVSHLLGEYPNLFDCI